MQDPANPCLDVTTTLQLTTIVPTTVRRYPEIRLSWIVADWASGRNNADLHHCGIDDHYVAADDRGSNDGRDNSVRDIPRETVQLEYPLGMQRGRPPY